MHFLVFALQSQAQIEILGWLIAGAQVGSKDILGGAAREGFVGVRRSTTRCETTKEIEHAHAGVEPEENLAIAADVSLCVLITDPAEDRDLFRGPGFEFAGIGQNLRLAGLVVEAVVRVVRQAGRDDGCRVGGDGWVGF